MEREYETFLRHDKPKGERYCCGRWRVVSTMRKALSPWFATNAASEKS
jgi:hypothetical protein